jgi:hypothetical protein
MEKLFTRRSILKGAGYAAIFGALAKSMLSCKKNSDAQINTNAKEDFVASCNNTGSLNEQQIAIRNNLRYVDKTPIESKTCQNCKLYTLPRNNADCGGCTVVPGPIHPQGYCISWYARM